MTLLTGISMAKGVVWTSHTPAASPPAEAKSVFRGLSGKGCFQVSVYWPGFNLVYRTPGNPHGSHNDSPVWNPVPWARKPQTPPRHFIHQAGLWKISCSETEGRVRMSYCSLALLAETPRNWDGSGPKQAQVTRIPSSHSHFWTTDNFFDIELTPTKVANQIPFKQKYKPSFSLWQPLACLQFFSFLSFFQISLGRMKKNPSNTFTCLFCNIL